MPSPPTRREFLATSSTSLSAAWLASLAPLIAAAQACARDALVSGAPFTTFTEREGADFEALAARIIPTDDTPGAREAGSVYFADQALRTFLSELLPIVREGLARLSERAATEGAPFAELPETAQDALVGAVEREAPQFFFIARSLTVLGLVTNPEYGGNRNEVGWQLVGFESLHAYQPPFGYYDRNEHGVNA